MTKQMLKKYLIIFVFLTVEHYGIVLNSMESDQEASHHQALREWLSSLGRTRTFRRNSDLIFNESNSEELTLKIEESQEDLDNEDEAGLLKRMYLGELKPLLVSKDIARYLITFGYTLCSLNMNTHTLKRVINVYDFENQNDLYYILLSSRDDKSHTTSELHTIFLKIAKGAGLLKNNVQDLSKKDRTSILSNKAVWAAISHVASRVAPNIRNAFVFYELLYHLLDNDYKKQMLLKRGIANVILVNHPLQALEGYSISTAIQALKPYANLFLVSQGYQPDNSLMSTNAMDQQDTHQQCTSVSSNRMPNRVIQERLMASYRSGKFLAISIGKEIARFLFNLGYPVFKMTGHTVQSCIQITSGKDIDLEQTHPLSAILLQRKESNSLRVELLTLEGLLGDLVVFFNWLDREELTEDRKTLNILSSVILRLELNDYNSFILYQIMSIIRKNTDIKENSGRLLKKAHGDSAIELSKCCIKSIIDILEPGARNFAPTLQLPAISTNSTADTKKKEHDQESEDEKLQPENPELQGVLSPCERSAFSNFLAGKTIAQNKIYKNILCPQDTSTCQEFERFLKTLFAHLKEFLRGQNKSSHDINALINAVRQRIRNLTDLSKQEKVSPQDIIAIRGVLITAGLLAPASIPNVLKHNLAAVQSYYRSFAQRRSF